ncbi:MAG: hypothetical protein H6Q14_2312 [Bacteroidetes bacterium]|jgi:hypothetical protein|nr:hypothetical protein [Bacteroidota bacterium]
MIWRSGNQIWLPLFVFLQEENEGHKIDAQIWSQPYFT